MRSLDEAGFARLASGDPPYTGLLLTDPPLAPREVLEMLKGISESLRGEFSENAWIALHDNRVVALCSITRHLVSGQPEIGYGTAPGEQGRGAASAAVEGAIHWAQSNRSVTALRAETSTGNIASQRVLERNGFVRIGERTDPDDGALICWRRTQG